MLGRVLGLEDAVRCHLHSCTESRGHIYCPGSEEGCVLNICEMCISIQRVWVPGLDRGERKMKERGGGSGSLCAECPPGTADHGADRRRAVLLC